MPDPSAFAEFHFLRPAWLLALLPAAMLWLIVRRRGNVERQWRKVIAPHLLAHLKVGSGDRWRFRPLHLTVLVLVLGAAGLAGPTWEREISPLAEDTAPLIIALDLSASMNAVDVQPTRLERAKQKVRDLLILRTGARSALIAYAGSAHIVLPLCDDPAVFETFLAGLESDVMPVAGKEPALALALAEKLLADEPTPGSILFLTDGIAEEHAPVFADHARRGDDEVLVLAVGTREGGPIRKGEDGFETDASGRRAVATLDIAGLQALEAQAGAFVDGVTVDDADVGRIQRRVQSHMLEVRQQDETVRWKDQGYWLAVPVALLSLLWFRKGWTIRWSAVALVLLLTTPGCAPAGRADSRFVDLWWTADQQGRRQFERGDHAEAAERFDNPMWKGVAHYRAGDFELAADSFARLATMEASFNLGNAHAMLGRYEEALAAYEAALADRPDWTEAAENRDLVLAELKRQEQEADEEEQPPGGEPSFEPDEVQFDEKGDKGQAGEIEMSQLSDEQLAEMWMRRLQTTPADFLRQRFAMEAAEGSPETGP
jgi:Ca-activated chloride channel family protein